MVLMILYIIVVLLPIKEINTTWDDYHIFISIELYTLQLKVFINTIYLD